MKLIPQSPEEWCSYWRRRVLILLGLPCALLTVLIAFGVLSEVPRVACLMPALGVAVSVYIYKLLKLFVPSKKILDVVRPATEINYRYRYLGFGIALAIVFGKLLHKSLQIEVGGTIAVIASALGLAVSVVLILGHSALDRWVRAREARHSGTKTT